MSKQMEAAKNSLSDWLSHENELGKTPSKIEPVGQFTRHDMTYYMFKYKKGLLGKWLLGVCGGYNSPDDTQHCGHVFSEMQPYDPATAEENAIAMVEKIRQFWMNQAEQYQAQQAGDTIHPSAENSDTEPERSPSFISFVLLSKPEWDTETIAKDMISNGFNASLYEASDKEGEAGEDGDNDNPEVLFFEKDGMTSVISLMPAPVPGGEAEQNAATNYFWPEAVAVTKTHQAHLIVAVLPKENSNVDAALALVQSNCACLKQENAIGIFTAGTVMAPQFYLDGASAVSDGQFPLLNLVYIGLYGEKGKMSGYTFGLHAFGKDELEVLNSSADPEELHGFLCSISEYVITSDVTLQDGETIGFSAKQKLPITRSKGVGVNVDDVTLKIGFKPA